MYFESPALAKCGGECGQRIVKTYLLTDPAAFEATRQPDRLILCAQLRERVPISGAPATAHAMYPSLFRAARNVRKVQVSQMSVWKTKMPSFAGRGAEWEGAKCERESVKDDGVDQIKYERFLLHRWLPSGVPQVLVARILDESCIEEICRYASVA